MSNVLTPTSALPIVFSSGFESGNGELVSLSKTACGCDRVEVRMTADPWSATDGHALQWFYFRLSHVRGRPVEVALVNAHEATFAKAWEEYKVAASYGGEDWFRVEDTQYRDGVLVWRLVPSRDCVSFAFFAPYSSARRAQLLADVLATADDECCASRLCAAEGHAGQGAAACSAQHRSAAACHAHVELRTIGASVNGRPIDLVRVGTPSASKRRIWVTARQHPGETMAEWCVEGLLRRLTDPHDPVACKLTQRATLYVVPCVNPDGAVQGLLRTNTAGVNLNRAWEEPDEKTAPEIACVLAAMDATGVDLFLDIHGDEILPYNFFVTNRGLPNFDDRHERMLSKLERAYQRASPDFQTKVGYPPNSPTNVNWSIGARAVGRRFDCVAVTLEQPFKDNADAPVPHTGWSPARALKLGAAFLDAALDVVGVLRD